MFLCVGCVSLFLTSEKKISFFWTPHFVCCGCDVYCFSLQPYDFEIVFSSVPEYVCCGCGSECE